MKQRKLFIHWMIEKVKECGTSKEISIKATRKFKLIFKITDNRLQVACIRKANRWCNGKEEFLNALSATGNRKMYVRCKNVLSLIEKRIAIKALHRWDWKRHNWIKYLHQTLLSEFERLSSGDVQLNRSVILYVAFTLLERENSTNSHLMLILLLVDQLLSLLQWNGSIRFEIALPLS